MTSHIHNQEEIINKLKIFIAEILKQDRPDSHLITVLHISPGT
jgi:hypothetical protein